MQTKHDIRLVVADIDGTLAPAKGNAHDLFQLQRLRVFCDLARRGKVASFALATGRNRSYVESILQGLGIPATVPHIIENGAALYRADTDEVITHPLYQRFGEARHAIAEAVHALSRETGCYEDLEKSFMFSLYPGAYPSIEALYEFVCERLQNFEQFVDVHYSSSAVDIVPKGINKGVGLSFLCSLANTASEQVLAIGDSHNDIPLIVTAGFGACPGNATDEIKNLVKAKQEKGFISLGHTTAGTVKALEHFFEIDLADPRLRKLSVEEALRRKQDVMCVMIPGENVYRQDKSVQIVIPDDPYIANTREQLAAISGNSHGSHYRWAAGGIAPILSTLNGDFLLTIYRDAGALTWPNTLTIPTGLSSDSSEFLDFEATLLREGFEEILVRTPHGLLAPLSHGISNAIDIEALATNSLGLARHLWSDLPNSLDWIPTDIITTRHDIPLTVSWRDKRRTSSCLITFHEITSGIDVVKIVRINFPYAIEELSAADGEEGPNGNLLNRDVYFLPISEIKRWVASPKTELQASHHFVSGRNLGSKQLSGISPLPFLVDAMRAISSTF